MTDQDVACMYTKWLILYCLIITGVAMAGGEPPKAIEHHYLISQETPVIEYRLSTKVESEYLKKFVQVSITDVVNPSLVPLSFTVYIKTVDQEKIFLGTFTLFPSDNPGSFIVPTQGKLKAGGSVFVSLDVSEQSNLQQEVEILMNSIKLVDEIDQ